VVQPFEQFPNRTVYFFQPEELLMAQGCDDPALRDLHTHFDLGLIPWTVGTCRHHANTVVHCELLVRGVEIRIVATGAAHSRARVIRNQKPRHSSEIFKGVHVGTEPGGQLLISGGFDVGVGTRTQHHHEQGSWPDLATHWILHRNRGSRPVDETLFAGQMLLAKNHLLLLAPPPVEFAETTVTVSFRMNLPILFPSQLQS
jgi:hypothetical protein